jgi:hypothetical protein
MIRDLPNLIHVDFQIQEDYVISFFTTCGWGSCLQNPLDGLSSQKYLHLWFEWTDFDEIDAIFHLRIFPIEYTMNRLLMWGGNVVVHFFWDTLAQSISILII